MNATDLSSLLHRMAAGTHRRFGVNGHRVYVRCSATGERYVLIDGAHRFDVNDSTFDTKVNQALEQS